jgi:hypothetical protein
MNTVTQKICLKFSISHYKTMKIKRVHPKNGTQQNTQSAGLDAMGKENERKTKN